MANVKIEASLAFKQTIVGALEEAARLGFADGVRTLRRRDEVASQLRSATIPSVWDSQRARALLEELIDLDARLAAADGG